MAAKITPVAAKIKPLSCALNKKSFSNGDLLAQLAARVPLQSLAWPELESLGLKLYCHRNDLISNTYSGNKFYKLYYNLAQAIEEGKTHLLSFGGAYSNHLHALAAIGAELGVNTIGVIRGHKPKTLSPTLLDAKNWGMALYFVDKNTYRAKTIETLPDAIAELVDNQCIHIVPEGGSNLQGAMGCVHLARAIAMRFVDAPYSLCSATATGTTLAGLTAGSPEYCHNIGISVLKGENTLSQQVEGILQNFPDVSSTFSIETAYHCGGYAKVNDELFDFIQRFETYNSIPLDPVYTAKMLLAVEKLAKTGYWPAGSRIVTVHTGGLQGRRGFQQFA